MATKWGIMSAGKICNDFVNALNYLPNDEHVVMAVAASNKEKAEEFARKNNIPVGYGSYEDLAKDKSIDIIYIGSINSLHYAQCKMVLENGKHLLCEKPLCLNFKDAEELVSIAKKKKLFFMEAVWSRCFPVYDELRKLLAANAIGDVFHLKVEIGMPISEVDRLKLKELGGGTVFDLGVYALQFAILVFGRKPLSVSAVGHLNEHGVDEGVNYILKYDNGKTANLCSHSKVMLDNSAVIYGSKGNIRIKAPFWCPTALSINDDEELKFPLPDVKYEPYFGGSAGLVYEAIEVRNCLQKGLLECPKMNHEDTLTIAKLQEEVCKLIGCHY
ncbi:trans-1,2-dihydrobenzene-1,2-diol dehydrogenase [Halyomorpha halys]|uniref:trans-1,2-dihydrobenzene-1,2-diol dehydrogenase n=1 Tax=Halyomorpha halys TaxID=286706 RepID=UPI0006D5107C|nr:trans-1,2-dihydrobenzene-1,2-diol dehydrogenase-like [Halyomorpha halys]XP_014274427.1 trans-1,2-dihydrobenzene-1,2-diol dehydrogenase-like [Halyomorpha halys]